MAICFVNWRSAAWAKDEASKTHVSAEVIKKRMGSLLENRFS
jgi:hypothetical protein